jgi:hypothetical protein
MRAAQLARLQTLLRDQGFALEMAQFLDAAYYRGIGQAVPPFLKPEEETATAAKSVREEEDRDQPRWLLCARGGHRDIRPSAMGLSR